MSELQQSVLDDLQTFSDLSNDELGEYSNALLIINSMSTAYGMSDDFRLALDVEIMRITQNFKDNTRIETVTTTPEPQTYTKLIWNDE